MKNEKILTQKHFVYKYFFGFSSNPGQEITNMFSDVLPMGHWTVTPKNSIVKINAGSWKKYENSFKHKTKMIFNR